MIKSPRPLFSEESRGLETRTLRALTSSLPLQFLLVLLVMSIMLLTAPGSAWAQSRTEYRAFWVDTFNTALNNHTDVLAVVNNAKAAKANAIFAQVRRRGDAWYLNSLEPPPDPSFIQPGFDALQDLIDTAHAEGIEVHAFVIMSAIWNKNPTVAGGLPADSRHAFRQHSGYDPATKTIVQGPNNWLTRTLLPDNTGNAISFQGHRFGSDFWLDFGHPDAAAFTVDVLTHLVRNYEIDGLHLDRIRYPEFSILTGQPAQTPTNGTNIGYNSTSIERFQRHYGIAAGSPPPATGNPLWMQWRRDQVTNVVRRVYLNAIALRPSIKVSAALIAFGGGPVTENQWRNAEAYWRVYQDWRAWTEEGIIDIAIPMNYKRENVAAQVTQYDQWSEWVKNHQYNRGGMVGQGALSNSIEGTLRQTRRALAPSSTGNSGLGVIFFSMATSNIAVASNPHAIPPGNTPVRSFSEFASGLTTSKSVDGTRLYEDPTTNPTPIFSEPATIPVLPWKVSPTVGHVMGFARRSDNTPLDAATVTIENLDTHTTRTTVTDGAGFFGGVDLAPGQYIATAALHGDTVHTCVFNVVPGQVTTADARPERVAPVTAATLTSSAPATDSGWYKNDVTLSLAATDDCAGVSRTEYSTDGGTTWLTYGGDLVINTEGASIVSFRSLDRAGNVETTKSVTVKIDKTAPAVTLSANPTIIWPPNGQTVNVQIDGNGSDALSGLASATYTVTDEYGAPLAIAPRTLGGNSEQWTETLAVEASRHGDDLDGRRYVVNITVTDLAGNTSTDAVEILVPHDRRH